MFNAGESNLREEEERMVQLQSQVVWKTSLGELEKYDGANIAAENNGFYQNEKESEKAMRFSKDGFQKLY